MQSLEREERLGRGLTRIAREIVDRTVAHLTDPTEDAATRVHETRKRLKELRAVLRLGRFALDDFQNLNFRFRDAGRDLASARAAEAMLETVKSLRAHTRDPLERRALTRVRRILTAEGEQEILPGVAAEVAQRLADTRDALSFPDGTRWFGRGLRRTYRDGRRGFRLARQERTATAIHEWRKRVKDLWYHAQIVEPVWPDLMDAHIAMLHDLSDLLGDHHDICALAALVAENPGRFGRITAQRIAAVVAHRLREIESEIFEKGPFAYAQPPRAWSGSIVRYWQACTERL